MRTAQQYPNISKIRKRVIKIIIGYIKQQKVNIKKKRYNFEANIQL